MSISETPHPAPRGPYQNILLCGAGGPFLRTLIHQIGASGHNVRYTVDAATEGRTAGSQASFEETNTCTFVDGVSWVCGRAEEAGTMTDHFRGVDTLLLRWRSPSLQGVRELLQAARGQVRRIVFLSWAEIDDTLEQQRDPVSQFHLTIEQWIRESGIDWTILRIPWTMSQVDGWWRGQLSQGDVVRWAFGDARLAPIHDRDLGEAAAALLTQEGHSARIYCATGPQFLSQRDLVAVMARVTGKPIRFEQVSPDEARPLMYGVMTEAVAETMLYLWNKPVEPMRANPCAEQLITHPPRSFAGWVAAHLHLDTSVVIPVDDSNGNGQSCLKVEPAR